MSPLVLLILLNHHELTAASPAAATGCLAGWDCRAPERQGLVFASTLAAQRHFYSRCMYSGAHFPVFFARGGGSGGLEMHLDGELASFPSSLGSWGFFVHESGGVS